MGLTLTAKFENAPKYHMSAMSFSNLRIDVASAISPEYGESYKGLSIPGNDYPEYFEEHMRLARKYMINDKVLDFLFQKEVKGHLSPNKCSAVLDVIGKTKNRAKYGYIGLSDDSMTWLQFKELLSNCYEKGKFMVWY